MEEHDWINIIPVLAGGCLSVRQQHMTNISTTISDLPPEQRAIRDKCFHPTGRFVEFRKEEIEQSIPDRFEKIVRLFPEQIAVKTDSHVVTYAELNSMANRVAHAIVAQNGSEVEPVALLFEKGIAQITAMLGVLKAGKFFVLLDPSFPKARIATILKGSQARLMITGLQNISLAREVADSRCQLMEFESIDRSISTESLRLRVSPKALAFILYTSGSTGQPKGVVQTHRNWLHNVMLFTHAYEVCGHDRIALLPSGTAVAITHTLIALLNGTVLLPFDVQKEGVTRLVSWLLEEKISICFISSPLFRNLCGTLTGMERFLDLRLIRLGSEAVYKNDIDLYKKFFSPNCVLTTGLACSETGLLRTYRMDNKTDITGSEVPVGYPVEDKEILLLDDTGKEIGFNEVGEIVVRSRYLSPGYWHRSDLTKAKFKPDPRGGDQHLYLTGDLGFMFSDGCLVYKGRKDFRVKVRGYGVELAEVEKALLGHATIKEVVAVARQDELGEVCLVAYFSSFSQPSPGLSELRSFLSRKLPDYMIPSVFVKMDSLPLTPNGKVDRKALPIPDGLRPDLETPFVAPRTPIEKDLAKIWAKVLSLDHVGIHDNFFHLGGHSLAATRVISRVIDRFKVELPIKSLFESGTVAAMSLVIVQNQARRAGEKELARMLTEIESLSDREAQRLLAEESK